MSDWIKCADRLPPSNKLVMTKISDDSGDRNVAMLSRSGNLWFVPGGMYVYYRPTHWCDIPAKESPWSEAAQKYRGVLGLNPLPDER